MVVLKIHHCGRQEWTSERTLSLTPSRKRQNHNLGGCCGFAFDTMGKRRLGLHLLLFWFRRVR